MIDALDAQLAPLDRELRAYARRQPGCRALMAHYGIGELTAVTILAELGDARRFSSSRARGPLRRAWTSPCTSPISAARPGICRRQGPPALRWALFEAAQVAAPRRQPRPRLLPPGRRAARRQPRLPVGRAQAAQAQLPHAARARRGGAATRVNVGHARAALTHTDAPRPAPRHAPAATPAWTALKDRAAATLPPAGSPHQPSCRRPGANPGRGPR